jgi:hypothetical protein
MKTPNLAHAAAKFYADVDDNIATSGRTVVGVLDPVAPFSYTIGNHVAGLPELIVFGLDPRDAQHVLNAASAMPGLAAVGDGDPVDIGGKVPLRAVVCPMWAKCEFAIQAGRYLRTDNYRLLQLLVPDRQGRYPGDPDCQPPYRDAPVLRGPAHG